MKNSKLFKNPQGVIGIILITFIITLAIFAQQIAPHNPLELNPALKLQEPSNIFPFGTDQLGRCVFSRIIYGARYSMIIAIPTLMILSTIGILVGATIAYKGGILDRVIMVICDILGSFPSLIIVISLVGILGNSISNIIIAAIISSGAWFIRMGKSYSKIEANKDYIISAKIAGASDFSIIINHIIPNVLPQFLIFTSSGIASMILMISGFSYLGIGLEAGIPEWGAMLTEANALLYSAPRLIILPGIFIVIAAGGFTFLAEALRDILTPEDTTV